MGLIYNLKIFEKEINKPISISITFFVKEIEEWKVEFVQGVLKSIDLENDTIEIEQHFPFINFIYKNKTQTVYRIFKNKDFKIIECGNIKCSK